MSAKASSTQIMSDKVEGKTENRKKLANTLLYVNASEH
jgi:hypothetical protein